MTGRGAAASLGVAAATGTTAPVERRRREGLARAAGLVAAYPPLMLGALWWHSHQGARIERGTAALLLAMGLGAALAGLLSVVVALTAVKRTRRVAALALAVAVVVRSWTPWSGGPNEVVWQMTMMLLVEVGILIVTLGLLGLLGCHLGFDPIPDPADRSGVSRRARVTIPDFLLLIAALAALFAVLRTLGPSAAIPPSLYRLLVEGGACAALVALVVVAAVFGTAPAAVRGMGATLVAPLGGLVYLWVRRHLPPGVFLLFDAPFYSGVTTAQVTLMALPGLALRSGTLRFRRAGRHRDEQQPPKVAAAESTRQR